MSRFGIALVSALLGIAFTLSLVVRTQGQQPLLLPEESKHLSQLRQLTFEGTNAEAYWSPDGEWLVFQSTRPPYKADQIFVMRADGSGVRVVSTGKGRCTCAYFTPDGKGVIFATTHLAGPEPPQVPKLTSRAMSGACFQVTKSICGAWTRWNLSA